MAVRRAARVLLVGGGFGGGVHAVLGDFVDAAKCGLLGEAEELVEGAGAFADAVGAFDGFGYVRFREDYGLAKRRAVAELSGDRG